ncbi:response regulator transcription factor [Streptomyces sp. NPDC037389]|uniref:response regulator transcription factor n=1 Tax=Streptomyces sp. NPDC037389 TaxID=3155369 RepID=UPI0033D20F94
MRENKGGGDVPDPATRVTVVVADEHPAYREGVVRGLRVEARIDVRAEAEDGVAALTAIRDLVPHVALVDYRLPKMDGVAVIHAVVEAGLPTRVVLLSAATDAAVVYRALREGAAGHLAKDAKRPEFVEAVLAAADGRPVPPETGPGPPAGEDATALSDRERQVLLGFAEGKGIPQLAAELRLAANTVKTVTQGLYEKLGVPDRATAVAEAVRRGLLD